jgi:uncharacterized protein (TIGR03437 family)
MQSLVAIALLAFAGYARAASYTAYIGDTNQYQASAIAADAAGNTWVTGSRVVVPAPTIHSRSLTDVFVSKLDSSGNLTLLGTFSGKGTDQANGIAVDPSGNIYIVGNSTSTDFPLHNPLQSTSYTSGTTGFLLKLSPNGTVVYSTWLGGAEGVSSLNSVAADAQGNAYVTGVTAAQDYQRTTGMPAGSVFTTTSGAFFAEVSPTGSQILYAGALVAGEHACVGGSSCFLSSIGASGASIAVDPAGNAYIAGNTNGFGLPTTPGALLENGIGAFVAKVSAAGTGMVYVTYLGAGQSQPGIGTVATDSVSAITADTAGNAYISGSTSDPAFPVTAGVFQPTPGSTATPPFVAPPDAFVAKLNPGGSGMVWATYLGGTAADAAQTIAVDPAGNVWASGTTMSTDFPTTVSVTPSGREFLAELNSTGSALSYSARFPANTVAQALAVDTVGTVHVGGATGLISAFPSGSAPGQTTTPWMFGIANAAGGTLSGRLAPAELISLYGLHIGPAAPVSGAFNTGGFLPSTLAGVQVTINGTAAPMLYVSDAQINLVAPVELTAGSSVELQITRSGTPLPAFRTMVDSTDPGVFLSAGGNAAAINQDGTLNSQANPAKAGSYISIWATGTGFAAGNDGQVQTGAQEFCTLNIEVCTIFQLGQTTVPVSYSGSAPGIVNGVVQINFQVTGSQSYYFSPDGISLGAVFGVYTTP